MNEAPRRTRRLAVVVAAGLAAVVLATRGASQQPEAERRIDAPAFDPEGKLLKPADYREWVFVTSGLGMTYGPAREARGEPRFDNVFVTRAAYQAFLKSGTWPERTMFILEVRRGETQVSINNGGRTQGDLVALEAAVKDRSRFPGEGWGYYSFDGPDGPLDRAEALPASASCHACHRDHGAVDHTFVQFYPTLLEAAKRHGTLQPDRDARPAP